MDKIPRSELESGMGSLTGNYSTEEREKIERKSEELRELMAWMKENYHNIPPRFACMFTLLTCEVLSSAGYKVDIDPGEIF